MSRRRALVTGASRGIGRAIAIALADAGLDVAISARTLRPGTGIAEPLHAGDVPLGGLPGSLEETAAAVRAAGVATLLVPSDLTDRASVGAAADLVESAWGGVDVLVHNGRHLGPGLMDGFLDTPVESYDRFLAAHLVAPVILTRSLLPGMLERGHGTIVTISSQAAFQPPPAAPGNGGWGLAYSVGKAAGHHLVPALHLEFGARGLSTFNVDPGYTLTERGRYVAAATGRVPAEGTTPEDAARVVAWLVTSPDAEALRGSSVEVRAALGLLPAPQGVHGAPA